MTYDDDLAKVILEVATPFMDLGEKIKNDDNADTHQDPVPAA